MNIEEKFNVFIQKAKNTIFLKKEEKESVRLRVIDFMRENSLVNNEANSQHDRYIAHWSSLLRPNKYVFLRALVMSLMVLLLGISGISLAANSSLPGDFLYPVKVGVNEKVLSFLLFSDKAKAEYDIHLAKLRLEEGEKVAVGKKLDDQTKSKLESLLSEHIDNAEKHFSKTKNHTELSAEINSDLEASLHAHTQILRQLANEDGEHNAKNVKSILSEVQTKTDEATKARQDSEHVLSLQPSNSVRSPAEDKLAEAEKELDEVTNFIESKKSSLSQDAYSIASANMILFKNKIAQSKDEIASGDYSKAFSTSQEAIRIGQGTKIRLETSIDLKIEVPKVDEENNGIFQEHDNQK